MSGDSGVRIDPPTPPTPSGFLRRLIVGGIIFLTANVAIGILSADLTVAVLLGIANGAVYSFYTWGKL